MKSGENVRTASDVDHSMGSFAVGLVDSLGTLMDSAMRKMSVVAQKKASRSMFVVEM